MDGNSPTNSRSPSKRKSPSSESANLPRSRHHKRLRTIECEEPPNKSIDPSPNKHTSSLEQVIESNHEDQASETEPTVSEPMDIESEDLANNQLPFLNNPNVLNIATRTPILAQTDLELTTSELDALYSDGDLDSEDEDDNYSATKESSPSHRGPSRIEIEYYGARADIDYYNSLTENELRREAIRWMDNESHRDPNGTAVFPPSWYLATRFDPPRPKVWIKDFFTGKVRPRQLVNDELTQMTAAQREEWVREHGMGGSDEGDTEMETQ